MVKATIYYRDEDKKPETIECSFMKTKDGFAEFSWSGDLFKKRYIPADLIKEIDMESTSGDPDVNKEVRKR